MSALDLIAHLNPCHEARGWLAEHDDPREAWESCERGDWLLWLAWKAGVDRRLMVRAAVSCAWPALRYVPDGEERPRMALEAALSWADGWATLDEVRHAAYAAYDAYAAYAAAAAAFAADAADAAYAAAFAADAADAACAADAAYAAAYVVADADAAYVADAAAFAADACADARRASLAESAERVREVIGVADVLAALAGKDDG